MLYATYLLVDLFPVGLMVAALSDIRSMTIPNRLTLALSIVFFPAALFAGLTPEQWISCLSAGGIGLLLGMICFFFRLMGGGDAKLIAATSLWIGLSGISGFLLYTAIMGGILTLGLMIARQALRPYIALRTKPLPEWLSTLLKPKGDLPYGVAICAGGIMALPLSPIAYLFGLG